MTSVKPAKTGKILAAARRDLRNLNDGKLPTTLESEVIQRLAESLDSRASATTAKVLLEALEALRADQPVNTGDALDEIAKARRARSAG